MILFKNKYGWQESVSKKDLSTGTIEARRYMNVRFVKCQEPVGSTNGNGTTMAKIEPINWWHGLYKKKDGTYEYEIVIKEFQEEGQKVEHRTQKAKGVDYSNLAKPEDLPFDEKEEEEVPFFE